jgi:Protein of unknown function (DUF1571)
MSMTRLRNTSALTITARGWSARLWSSGVVSFLVLAIVGGAPQTPTAPPLNKKTPPDKTSSPMDEPLRLLAAARTAYKHISDYSCTMIKRERIDGELQPANVISMKVRAEPFSVYLQWQEPKEIVGQEACYVAGKNDGKMRVKAAGTFVGLIGFVPLDPNDPRAQATSRHSITEAGIGNLLDRFTKGWTQEKQWGQTQVKVAEYDYNKRRCVRVETIHPKDTEKFVFHRNVVYFDKETHLPVRTECYDWPKNPGEKGELVEVYSYVNVKVNVGLEDDVFDH